MNDRQDVVSILRQFSKVADAHGKSEAQRALVALILKRPIQSISPSEFELIKAHIPTDGLEIFSKMFSVAFDWGLASSYDIPNKVPKQAQPEFKKILQSRSDASDQLILRTLPRRLSTKSSEDFAISIASKQTNLAELTALIARRASANDHGFFVQLGSALERESATNADINRTTHLLVAGWLGFAEPNLWIGFCARSFDYTADILNRAQGVQFITGEAIRKVIERLRLKRLSTSGRAILRKSGHL